MTQGNVIEIELEAPLEDDDIVYLTVESAPMSPEELDEYLKDSGITLTPVEQELQTNPVLQLFDMGVQRILNNNTIGCEKLE